MPPDLRSRGHKNTNKCAKIMETCMSVAIYCEVNKRNDGPSFLTKFVLLDYILNVL